MAILDTQRNLVVLRIVYDGPPMSGKTTSVRMLAEGLERPTVTPQEVEGRTLFFDWMDYVGGLFDGHRIRCQIVSVPGQRRLAERRRFLLSTADSVVFVADTTAAEWDRSREVLAETYDHLQRASDVPVGVVLQANKRDRADAIPTAALREQLSSRAALGIVETVASEGRGIREAFVFGVRLALDRVRELSRLRRLEQGGPYIDDPDALMTMLKDAESAAGVALELTDARPSSAPAPAQPTSAVIRSAHPELLHAPSSPAPSSVAPSHTAATRNLEPRPPLSDIGLAFRYPETASTLATLARQAEISATDTPPRGAPDLPNASVPSGRIWPPVEGRVLLNELDTLTARQGPELTDEGDWQLVLRDSDWIVHSHADSEFSDVRDGEAELLVWARMHAAGRHRLSEGRCIVLAQSSADRWRLWQIIRRRPSVEVLVRESLSTGNAAVIAKTLFDAARLLSMAYTSFNEPPCRLPCNAATVGTASWRAIFLGLFPAPGQGQRPLEGTLDAEFARKQLTPIVRGHGGISRINLDEAFATLQRLSMLQPDQRSATDAVRMLLAS